MHGNITPYNLTLRIPQRAKLSRRIQLSLDGDSINIVSQIWNPQRTVKLLDLTVNWIARNTVIDGLTYCDFELTALWSLTKEIKADGMWDLLVIDQGDPTDRGYYFRGPAILDRGFTEPV